MPLLRAGFCILFYARAMRLFVLPSFAKINLNLRVLVKVDHGFHELFTVFQTVSLHDSIRFARRRSSLVLTCSVRSIPKGERNIIIGAARAMRFVFGVSRGATIHLEKCIPSPGGLGGGSSNAAVALIAGPITTVP